MAIHSASASTQLRSSSSQRFLLRKKITICAKKLGFDLIGFSPAKIAPLPFSVYKKWLKKGFEGEMDYMKKSSPRRDLQKILPGAKSVIVLAVNYYREQSPLKKGYGRIARYAYGRDYHKIIKKALIKLEEYIHEIAPSFTSHPREIKTKSYVDTGPILERTLAYQAGLGHIGKNSCLITSQFGSWIFLAEIITNLPLQETFNKPLSTGMPAEKQSLFSLCGCCIRCMQACPTGAIIAPGVIDARRCIAYLTIESKSCHPFKGDLENISQISQLTNFSKKSSLNPNINLARRLFGCDICQEVCPHNIARQKPILARQSIASFSNCTTQQTVKKVKNFQKNDKTNTQKTIVQKNRIHTALSMPIAGDQLSLKHILSLKSDKKFLALFAGSPLMRAKKKELQHTASSLL